MQPASSTTMTTILFVSLLFVWPGVNAFLPPSSITSSQSAPLRLIRGNNCPVATIGAVKIDANSMTSTALAANRDGKSEKKKPSKAQGVYVRPSGAIEQGSGFFVPGLEGPKVRLVIGLVLLAATGINHFVLGTYTGEEGISFSEGTAIVYSVLLLFQFAIEYAKEAFLPPPQSSVSSSSATRKKIQDSLSAVAAASEVLEQKWSGILALDDGQEEKYRSRVQWAAASYLAMTPTTQIMLLASSGEDNRGDILYRLGGKEANQADDGTTIDFGVKAALDELRGSKGGRIALPLNHPAVEALLPMASLPADSESTTADGEDLRPLRTVILQRIADDSCWMASSDQLLAGYTSGDLKWLGQMAEYVGDRH